MQEEDSDGAVSEKNVYMSILLSFCTLDAMKSRDWDWEREREGEREKGHWCLF